jgi:cytoskeletal protein CcmA (bactofilin family)
MEAGEVMVGGTVHGNVQAGKVVLRGNSKVYGDIVYKQLVIEEGASFEGRCDIATNQQSLENAESQPEIPTIQEYPEKPDEESSV